MPNHSALARIAMDRIGEPPTQAREEPIAALHELIDALTAVGNYLAAANRLFDDSRALKQEKRLGETLAKSLNQSQRANDAARWLRQSLSGRTGCQHDRFTDFVSHF